MVREDPFNFLSGEESADVRADLEEHYGTLFPSLSTQLLEKRKF